ncbi:MAG: SulP family inorganic anion transporter [Firmicutes bacterium]|nr:SulP family inorganic anion transporter [Bacillota bacterium]
MRSWWGRYRGDVAGGLTAAIVALPLALAFGIASGAGAIAGLYASIFGGLVASVFGGCGVQISGPTGAMTAILVSLVAKHGLGGMLLAGILAGLMQIGLGLLRLGKFVKYLPQPVIAGFTNGISILFFMTAIGDAVQEPIITLFTALVIVLAAQLFKRVPDSLFGLVAGLALNQFIGSSHVVGEVAFTIPKFTFGLMPLEHIGSLIMPAVSICLLGSISALLSAQVTDSMTESQHDSNRELVGQGLGNLVSCAIGGVPITGAVARSGINVYAGGRTRVSGILHSLFLGFMVLVLQPVVRRIPMASLAAILMVSSVRTADWKSLRLIPRARWSYGAILIFTTILTVVQDLAIAVVAGVILAVIGVVVELAALPQGREVSHKEEREPALSYQVHNAVQVLAFHGPLFFVGVEQARNQIKQLANKPILVLDLSDVSILDETAALALLDLARRLQGQGKALYVAGLSKKALRMVTRMGLVKELGRQRLCRDINCALRRAVREAIQLESEEYTSPSWPPVAELSS